MRVRNVDWQWREHWSRRVFAVSQAVDRCVSRCPGIVGGFGLQYTNRRLRNELFYYLIEECQQLRRQRVPQVRRAVHLQQPISDDSVGSGRELYIIGIGRRTDGYSPKILLLGNYFPEANTQLIESECLKRWSDNSDTMDKAEGELHPLRIPTACAKLEAARTPYGLLFCAARRRRGQAPL